MESDLQVKPFTIWDCRDGGYNVTYYGIALKHVPEIYRSPSWVKRQKSLFDRKNIANYVNMPQKELTIYLRNEYHCLTNFDKSRYLFTSEENAEAALIYLNSVCVANTLAGRIIIFE